MVAKLYAENAKLKAVNTNIKDKYKELEVNLNKKKRRPSSKTPVKSQKRKVEEPAEEEEPVKKTRSRRK